MKQIKQETESSATKIKQAMPAPPPPPLPPPLPGFWARKNNTESVTNQEIAKFWRQRRIEEEDHLLAAIKAAARLRARNLSEDDYKRFEESLSNADNDTEDKDTSTTTTTIGQKEEASNEVRVGVKDWWTKSKYAYLNQPAIKSMDPPRKRTSTFVPNCLSFRPTPLYPTSVGVF